jgi:hypothetical protein
LRNIGLDDSLSKWSAKKFQPEVNLRDKKSLAASNSIKKVDLKNAAEVFGLWDNVYGKDAIRSLENSQRWDPAKKDKDVKKPVKKVKSKFSLFIVFILKFIFIAEILTYSFVNYSMKFSTVARGAAVQWGICTPSPSPTC